MGMVYKAQDLKLDRPVAIKFISREIAANPEQRTRFVREARTASLLDHPNICTIHEFGETPEGDLFIVMAFCPGENLRMRLERGPLPLKAGGQHRRAGGARPGQSAQHGHRASRHQAGQHHAAARRRSEDRGLRTGEAAADIGLTNTGGVVGTIPYMSPEQLRGDAARSRAPTSGRGA